MDDFLDLNLSPGRVIVRRGALAGLAEHLLQFGERVAWIRSAPGRLDLRRLRPLGISIFEADFGGECSDEEIERLATALEAARIAAGSRFDVVLASGGGKALDCAKAVAFDLRLPIVTVPTQAATCAAYTNLSVIYRASGGFRRYRYLGTNPNVLILDPDLVATAPVRSLRAGMADTLAKWYEPLSLGAERHPDPFSRTSLELAGAARQWLSKHGASALAREPDPHALETAIRVNVLDSGLVSGLGSMHCHAAAAHSVANGLSRHFRPGALYHGEMVAFGLLVSSRLIEESDVEYRALEAELRALGLPTSWMDLATLAGFVEPPGPALFAAIVEPDETIHLLEAGIDASRVARAVREVVAGPGSRALS